MTMITPSYLGETIEYSSLHACRSTLEDPTRKQPRNTGAPAGRGRSYTLRGPDAIRCRPRGRLGSVFPADRQAQHLPVVLRRVQVPQPHRCLCGRAAVSFRRGTVRGGGEAAVGGCSGTGGHGEVRSVAERRTGLLPRLGCAELKM